MRPSARAASSSPDNAVFLSAVTAWEISIKATLGRLPFPLDRFEEMAIRMGFEILPILPAHAIAAGQLPLPHAYPFDRMLIARARVEGLVLVSDDRKVAGYDVRVLT